MKENETEREGETTTDVLYDLTDYMEKQRHWMVLIIFACLILAPAGLLLNVVLLLIYSVRLGFSLFSVRGLLFPLNILICVLLVYFGIKQTIFLTKWNRKLKKIREFEEKVFKEVVKE